MLVHFACKGTARIFEGTAIKRLPRDLQIAVSRKLQMIHAATAIADVQAMPGLRCKKLTGTLKDFWSIRVNDQWRLIFTWTEPPPEARNVQLTDCH